MKTIPIVSICMITYGHEKYIKQAIEGVLMQQCNFKIELIIANDCSPDKTDIIVKKILNEHPKASMIRYISKEKNIGMMPNFISSINQCNGKYIALCEGDDYWTDPFKLQKQVDFLESNEDYVMCFHDSNYLFLDGTEKKFSEKYLFLKNKYDFTRRDLFEHKWFIATASIVFRNREMISNYLRDIYSGDSTLHLVLSKYGKFRFIPDCMSVYRITGNGASKVINTPEYRIHDLKNWMNMVEPYEKKFIYKQMFGNYKLLFFIGIEKKKKKLIFENIKNISKTLILYIYYSIVFCFSRKKTSF